MIQSLFASLALLLALAPGAQAATLVVDTGTPNGQQAGALAFDGVDWVAGELAFAQAAQIDTVQGHLLGGTAGETFDISLLADDGGAGPGSLLYSTTATFGADGWNGVSGLDGWHVGPGHYWIEFEIQGDDTLGSGSVTGALFDTGAPHPLAITASTSDAGFTYVDSPLSFGLRVSTVPWPSPAVLMLVGLALLSTRGFARRILYR
jgi:hypothetical protein